MKVMGLRAVRHPVVSRVLAAVLAAVVSGGALDWGHLGGDDPDCNPVLVHHDHSAHRFGAAPSQSVPPADHCYLCHSLRLLHTSVIARAAGAVPAVTSTPFRFADHLAAFGPVGVSLSSRAPPARSL